MKTAGLFFLSFTLFTACIQKTSGNITSVAHMNKDTAKAADDSLHYLALGDSYTIGESVTISDCYPYLLTGKLNLQKFPVSAPPTIIATTGWTTDELIDAIKQSNITGKKFDFVTLLIGVNDQYRGLSQDNYKIKFEQVLNTAIHFAGGNKKRVFVLSIPDWGVTPFANGRGDTIGPQIDRFNAINKKISKEAGVNYLDITGISRKAAHDPDLTAGDGFTPRLKCIWNG